MISEYEHRNSQTIRESVAEFCRNPYWNEYLIHAPSELCRRYIELDFHYSGTEDEELLPIMDQMEHEMTAEDLRYMMKHGHGPGKARYIALLKEKEC